MIRTLPTEITAYASKEKGLVIIKAPIGAYRYGHRGHIIPKGSVIRGQVERISDGEMLLEFTCSVSESEIRCNYVEGPLWNEYERSSAHNWSSSYSDRTLEGILDLIRNTVTNDPYISTACAVDLDDSIYDEIDGKSQGTYSTVFGNNSEAVCIDIVSVDVPDKDVEDSEVDVFMSDIRWCVLYNVKIRRFIRHITAKKLTPIFTDDNIDKVFAIYGYIHQDRGWEHIYIWLKPKWYGYSVTSENLPTYNRHLKNDATLADIADDIVRTLNNDRPHLFAVTFNNVFTDRTRSIPFTDVFTLRLT